MLNLEDRIKKFNEMMNKYIPTEFINWLEYNGFFTAPASTKYHGNYEGGLFDHSYSVAETLKQLSKANRLKWNNLRSPFVIGMFHDLCKIDNYIKVADGFDYNKAALLPGHGEKSIIYLVQHMRLTPEEVMCIRWHMGAFDEKENWNYYTKAVNKYPNVLWTHQADMIASQILGV
jgi:hypothetical protein